MCIITQRLRIAGHSLAVLVFLKRVFQQKEKTMIQKEARPLILVLQAVLMCACGQPSDTDCAAQDKCAETLIPNVESAPLSCDVAAGRAIIGLRTFAGGIAISTVNPLDPNGPLLVERARGEGCALSAAGAPVAATELLDVDDAGGLYVLGAAATTPNVLSSVSDQSAGDVVVRIDESGSKRDIVSAGRGIWTFGTSPSGNTIWVTACGPTGIFDIRGPELVSAMTPPDSGWHSAPNVLTADDTFWSIGAQKCVRGDCQRPLVRTRPTESERVAIAAYNLDDTEDAVLARCGSNVCGVSAGRLQIWDDEGVILEDYAGEDIGALPAEQLVTASGNESGTYIHLRQAQGDRLIFVGRGI